MILEMIKVFDGHLFDHFGITQNYHWLSKLKCTNDSVGLKY